ncbi:hypothetical protein Rhal01_03676 [Rubritalea halochordaticola]|uniref:Uncharacterized protein n=1 Tax=Rubritalea halochordaticola TaxID=714537 RepID=A0ABP9V662_9BACT
MQKFRVENVEYMPKILEENILYVSDRFGTAAHLCACGCGAKVRTPLGETEWTLSLEEGLPTLSPSVGNWQQDCKSHYFIQNGEIIWCGQWSEEKILQSRQIEQARREEYYNLKYSVKVPLFRRVFNWLKNLFKL